MKFRSLIFLLTMALPLLAAEEKPAATPKPTILKRWMHSLGIATNDGKMTATGFKGLEIGLQADPAAVKVSEVKQLKVTVTLINRGKKMVQLDFPTSQRIEVLVKSGEGKTIETWSEDQAFNNEPTMVTINPEERIEYAVNVATRDMVAGQTYAVEAFFPNFEHLRKAVTVAAVTDLPKGTAAPGQTATPAPEKPKKHNKF